MNNCIQGAFATAAAAAAGGTWEVIENYKSSGTADTKTFTFDAIDFDDYSELVLVIDGSITLVLELRIAINDLSGGMYSDGFRIKGGTFTAINLNNVDNATIATEGIFASDGESIAAICHIAFSVDPEQNTSIYSIAYPSREGFELMNNIHNAHIDSITSIVIKTSQSTWTDGTRMTLYKVSRS